MVDGSFSDAEVRVVLAHEIGHHSSKHIPKALAWFALFALPGAWVLMRATRRRGGMGEAAAVPLALLVVAVIQLALAPAQAWISRRMEAEADWKALADDPRPGRRARAVRRLRAGRRSETPTRRPGRTSCSTAIRRWRSASRWRRPGGSEPVELCRAKLERRSRRLAPRSPTSACTPGPEPPSGGVRRPPRAVIAPHWTQFDGVSFTSTVPSPSSSPTS